MRTRRGSAACRAIAVVSLIAAVVTLTIGFWIPAKAALAQILLDRAWDAASSGFEDARPWPWADTRPIARLAIPGLGESWVVLSGASGRNLAFAPAHVDGSAVPGVPGVAVISGHRDTHFAALESLAPGDELRIEGVDGATHAYRVFAIDIVDSTKARIRLDAAEPMLVLTTCYPFDSVVPGPLRYVVQAAAV